jgi:hypothetical protein
MEGIGKDAILLLQYLLPGFFAAWIFYGLTPYELPSQFERVIQALILTLIIQALVHFEKLLLDALGRPLSWSVSDTSSQLIASTITGLFIGLLFSASANHDTFHSFARRLGITQETSYPSEWFGAFCAEITYVVLQLNDERRVYGWPREWPSDAKEGHFVLEQPSWITEDGQDHPMTGVASFLIDVSEVKWVEFMEKPWESKR